MQALVNTNFTGKLTVNSKEVALKENLETLQEKLSISANYDASTSVIAAMKDITEAISGVTSFEYEVVTALPTTGDKGVIYLVPETDASGNEQYVEYIYVGSAFEKLGAKIDLSDYALKTEVSAVDTKVETLSTTVSGIQTSVSSLTTTVNENSTNISTVSTKVEELESKIEEVDAGLAHSYSATNAALTADSEGNVSWTITHNLASTDITVSAWSNNELVIVDATIVDENTITVSFVTEASASVDAGFLKVVVTK